MKKVLAGCLTTVLFATAAYAGLPARTGVNGSLHDMNVYVGANSDSMARVCVFCHTPHNSLPSADSSLYPLWNHAVPATNYIAYNWATPLNAGDGGSNNFNIVANQAIVGPSRLCLSCHDGQVNVDQHAGSVATTFGNGAQDGTTKISARANLGTDLSNDHPIGFDYNAIRTYREAHSLGGTDLAGNHEIVDSNTTFASSIVPSTSELTYNTVNRFASGRKIKDVLYEGNIMTCATCHEVHNKDNVQQDLFTGANGSDHTKRPNFFLYAQEKDSAICLSCHVK
jgi:cytochrome c553